MKNGLHTIKQDYLGIYTASYVLCSPECNVFLDTGLKCDPAVFDDYLNTPQAVLIATHGHWDHIGMHAYLRNKGVTLYAHAGDRHYMEDYDWHWQDLFGQYKDDFDLPPARWDTFQERIGSPFTLDVALRDGDVYRFGDMEFEVIHTPGHSDGSICLYERTNDILFTGDSLMGSGFFGGLAQYTDPEAYVESMRRLKKLHPKTVYSCHNDPMSGDGLAAKAQEGIETVRRVETLVNRFVQEKASSPELTLRNAVAYVCENMGKKVGGGACVSVMAHLKGYAPRYPRVAEIMRRHGQEEANV